MAAVVVDPRHGQALRGGGALMPARDNGLWATKAVAEHHGKGFAITPCPRFLSQRHGIRSASPSREVRSRSAAGSLPLARYARIVRRVAMRLPKRGYATTAATS